MFRAHDRDSVRFAIWVGHGRDPQIAYLDARLLAIATSEAGESGLALHRSGKSYNLLGGERLGDLDPAVLHRMGHMAVAADGRPYLRLPDACTEADGGDGLCVTAARMPSPGTPSALEGGFAVLDDHAMQWVMRDAVDLGTVVRRAVYMDERYLLEAASGPDGRPRVWPARGLMPFGLEFATPSARELDRIERRIAEVAAAAGRTSSSSPRS